MREVIGRIVHSPWFVVFLIALPLALVMALRESFGERLIVASVHVEVAPTEADGDAWDGKHGLPDPHLVAKQRKREVFACPEARDSLVLACIPDALVDPAKPLAVRIGDVDMTSDDVIAELELELPREGGTIVRERIGGLVKLAVTVTPRAGAAERFGSRLIAVGAGVVLTLLFWFLGLRAPLVDTESHALGWIGGAVAVVALGLGGLIAGEVAGIPPEAPCALGAVAATFGALHANAVEPLRWYAAVLMCAGAAAVLLPIVLTAGLIVLGVAFVYLCLAAIWDSL